ncbi:hypothetical protein EVAR_79661_1 [Eumeta japonica]|uniref:Uncharacterized protein n=1 Tax=Eumeta variegata TaxID=151549 RepID=A0A4C1WBF4_EUMVA|nr:hypothetical protein EVAR_79661_1 [Eumeta japonica]
MIPATKAAIKCIVGSETEKQRKSSSAKGNKSGNGSIDGTIGDSVLQSMSRNLCAKVSETATKPIAPSALLAKAVAIPIATETEIEPRNRNQYLY